jgi:hypothetical protein
MLNRKLLCEARELRVLAACKEEEYALALFVLLTLLTLTASSFARSLGMGGGKTKLTVTGEAETDWWVCAISSMGVNGDIVLTANRVGVIGIGSEPLRSVIVKGGGD